MNSAIDKSETLFKINKPKYILQPKGKTVLLIFDFVVPLHSAKTINMKMKLREMGRPTKCFEYNCKKSKISIDFDTETLMKLNISLKKRNV